MISVLTTFVVPHEVGKHLPVHQYSVCLFCLNLDLEYRYQIIVSSIKFRKVFAKFMIPIALFKKFLS